MEDIRRVWMSVIVEERMVKSVEGIPGFVRRVGDEGGVGVGLWAVLVGRIVRASRLKGLKFLKCASRPCLLVADTAFLRSHYPQW